MEEKRGGEPKRTAQEIFEDRNFIVPLFLQGVKFGDITAKLQELRTYPVDYKSVYRDMQQVIKGWKAERAKLMPAAFELQMRKLEKMEATCWEQFEKSKQAKTRTVQKERSVFDKKQNKTLDNLTFRQGEKHITETIGDGQWMDRIIRIWEMQAELLDLKNLANPAGGGDAGVTPVMTEVVFITRTRKANSQFTEAIEIKGPEEDGITQKLIQS